MLFGKKLKKENAELIAKNQRLNEHVKILEDQLNQKNAQNQELNAKIEQLEEQNRQLSDKAKLVIDAEFNANNYQKQLTEGAIKAYNMQIQTLKNFIARWQASLPEERQSPDLKRKLALSNALEEIIRGNTPILDIEQGALLIDKLNGVIGGKSAYEENGFDLNEVLNPSDELDLESLCRELGVMD